MNAWVVDLSCLNQLWNFFWIYHDLRVEFLCNFFSSSKTCVNCTLVFNVLWRNKEIDRICHFHKMSNSSPISWLIIRNLWIVKFDFIFKTWHFNYDYYSTRFSKRGKTHPLLTWTHLETKAAASFYQMKGSGELGFIVWETQY